MTEKIDTIIDYSEEDTKRLFITKALEKAGWEGTKIRMEVPIKAGRIVKNGKRKEPDFADYVLYYGNFTSNKPIAVVEAKRYKLVLGTGREQAIDYATKLDARFAFVSNGQGFIQIDLLTNEEKIIDMNQFPNVEELTKSFLTGQKIPEKVKEVWQQPSPYIEGKEPRYYQTLAINRTIEAIASGSKRAFLVLATGTGKTFVASNICWKLMKIGIANKILYLADRNILIGQTVTGDFKPFKDVYTTIHKTSDPDKMKAYKLFFALYQSLTEKQKDGKVVDPLAYIKEQFSEDYFDLIIVDECHRGSANKDSQWRAILDYFKGAIQIGMTATPKEKKDVSNISYFGKPLITYNLNTGIDDGFLAPYKVIRVNMDKDLEGYRPSVGTLDTEGNVVPDEIYGQKDFDKNIILDKRTIRVATRITDFMQANDPMAKTIVFCIDIEHAERMAQALKADPRNKEYIKKNINYIVRVTGGQGDNKKTVESLVEKFSALDEPYPVICTTSDLLTTGVDCKTCKVIAIDTIFGNEGMTKFKQIIGRGTRVNEEYNKYTFTILDFRNASRLFADPQFNGDPISIIEVGDEEPLNKKNDEEKEKERKPHKKIRIDDVEVNITSETVSWYDLNGKLVTESYKDFTKHKLLKKYSTLNDFLNNWTDSEKREAIKEELDKIGIDLDELRNNVGIKNIDDFDLLCHVIFDKKPLTRSERAKKVKQKDYFEKYGESAKQVLNILLDKYADGAIDDLNNMDILKLPELEPIGSPIAIVKLFGGEIGWKQAMNDMSRAIYR